MNIPAIMFFATLIVSCQSSYDLLYCNELLQLRSQVNQLAVQLSETQANLSKLKVDLIQKNGSFLVFRATAGINQPAYDTWISTGRNDDDPLIRAMMPCDCLYSMKPAPDCDQNYRSKIVDLWPSDQILTVRVSLYKGEVEEAFVTFNGTGSTRDSWFSKSRVLQSSWTDLISSPTNIFSIEGENGVTKRRFYINSAHSGCPNDQGWLAIKDVENDVCAWGKVPPYSAILYSPNSSKINWNSSGVRRADAMAIWVKFKVPVKFSESYQDCKM